MNTTRWLDNEEMRIWRAFIEVSGRVTAELDKSLKQNAGMTLDDYEVLGRLSEAPEHRMRMTAMSESLVHSQSRLTQRIDRLVKRGWVRREQCSEDRRGTLAVITSEGLAVIEASAPRHVSDVRELLIDLIEPAERAVIADVLERVAASARQRS